MVRIFFLCDGCQIYFSEDDMSKSESIWVKGRPAMKVSGRNIYDLQRLALVWMLRYRALPWAAVEFHRDDLVQLREDKGAAAAHACARRPPGRPRVAQERRTTSGRAIYRPRVGIAPRAV